MADITIPDDLVSLVREQRVIPFLGAGFSATHDMPTWEALLRDLSEEIQSQAGVEPVLSYDKIRQACGGDYLQIAEYLYLTAGESIGPIRQAISTSLRSDVPLLESTPHLELVNLGAPYVYTTNYDDLIENTYRELGLQVDVVAVPRDMALTHAERTEVVKYHGDLRHEHTLVLTESQYFKRLEFESPMDLKLRSDLLGRSVLFAGYSFQDINIRVIWFRLMQMMQDVPPKDRQPSYIVRLRANPVLDALYEAVGLRTLVIDPDERAETTDERNALLSEFMLELSLRCVPDERIPGTTDKPFVSAGLVSALNSEIDRLSQSPTDWGLQSLRHGGADRHVATTPLLKRIDQMTRRTVPDALRDTAGTAVSRLVQRVDVMSSSPDVAIRLASWSIREYGASETATMLVANGLMRARPRQMVLASADIDWARVWSASLSQANVRQLLVAIEGEIEGHERERFTDTDLAYAIDLAVRIAGGGLGEGDLKEERVWAAACVERAADLYPAVHDYQPADGRPEPFNITNEINSRARELAAREEEEGDDVE